MKKFKMPDRFYFPMHRLGAAEAMSVRPVEIDRGAGIVTAFIDTETADPVELASLVLAMFLEQLATAQA